MSQYWCRQLIVHHWTQLLKKKLVAHPDISGVDDWILGLSWVGFCILPNIQLNFK